MVGALSGIRIVEFAGIGPGPFCGMMLADHGAEVVRIDRPGAQLDRLDALSRSRRSIVIDMKKPGGIDLARGLCRSAHGLIEGYRPGVMERLGLSPDILIGDNPSLVYGRMTGWGQTGPLAQAAGHDINYIAISGVLHTIGPVGGKPVLPVNYVGDFGGGGMMLAFGMVSALLAVRGGAPGQVVDVAMSDGSALLAGMTWAMYAGGAWHDERGVNLLDGGAPFYDTYECADGRYVAIGSIEPQFYALLREKLGLAEHASFDAQHDPATWPRLKELLSEIFRARSRDAWCALLEGSDVCFAPVMSLAEAPSHPHNISRGTFIEVNGAVQPSPQPRFTATPAGSPRGAGVIGADTDDVLAGLGHSPDDVAALRAAGIVA